MERIVKTAEKKLNDIEPGESVKIRHITVGGSMRRRFLDLGLIEDTAVKCIGKSPCKDPKAYLIRGAVIAIRARDAENILVE